VEEGAAIALEDIEVHRSGMDVDAAVGPVLGLVESHHGPLSGGQARTVRHRVCSLKRSQAVGGHDEYPRAVADPAR